MQGSDGLSVGLKIVINFPCASERSFNEDLGQTVGLERRILEYDRGVITIRQEAWRAYELLRDNGTFVKRGGDFNRGPLACAKLLEQGLDINGISDLELARG